MSEFALTCTAIGCFGVGFAAAFLICTSRVVLPDDADPDTWSDFQ